jgi:Cu2+-exporting ATPase
MNASARGAAATCTHCKLPLGAGREARTADGECFCCTGCHVAHVFSGAGLEGAPDRLLARVVLSAFLAMGVMVFSLSLYGALLDPGHGEAGASATALSGVFRLGALALATPVFVLLGLPLLDAVIALRRWLSAEALVLAGASAAYAVSAWNALRGSGEVYFDTATMVILLYSLGRWMDVRARERSRAALGDLALEREPPARRIDGERETDVRAEALRRGDLVRIRPGELVPVDGVVVEGRSFLETSALTGESEPRSVGVGQRVLAGTRALDGTLVVEAEAVGGERLRDGVQRLLEDALRSRAHSVRFADRLAGWLLPVVLGLAVITALRRWSSAGPEDALLSALSVVLISCPCALGIATPMAFWTAIGAAWRRGVLVRGGEVLERLARARRVVFDKTGTLTESTPELECIRPLAELGESRLLELAAALEHGSEHPIGRSVRRAFAEHFGARHPERVEQFRALPGVGVQGSVAGRLLVLRRCDPAPQDESDLSLVELAELGGRTLGILGFRARLAPGAREAVERLRARGLELEVLTGDSSAAARSLAVELDLAVESGCSPLDKLERVRAAGERTIFVGDGLNDAAALAAADVGVSVAGGSAASLDAAQVNLLRPGLTALADVLELARTAVWTARFNLLWSFAYNAMGLGLAASGRLPPVFAASAMVVSSAVVLLTSGRLRGQAARVATEPSALPLAAAPANALS